LSLREGFLSPRFVRPKNINPFWHTHFIDIAWPVPIRFDVPVDCSAELSPSGYTFFTDLFEAFDKVGLNCRLCSQEPISINPSSYASIFRFRTWTAHSITRN
jgi:hypothetical protein